MTPPLPHTVPLLMQLRHHVPLGELAPYFHGLQAGRAIASRCPVCTRTGFPPRLQCPDHPGPTGWVELPGSGRIVAVTLTDGPLPFSSASAPRAFVLVALDGAENLAFGRLAEVPDATDGTALEGRRVWISRAAGSWPHPSQAACYVFDEQERQTESLP